MKTNTPQIRKSILNGLAVGPLAPTEGTVRRLIRKTLNAEPKNPVAYANFVARNASIDAQRSIERAQKKEIVRREEAVTQRKRAVAAQKEAARIERLHRELRRHIRALTPTAPNPKHLQVLEAQVLDGLSQERLARRFPGANAALRYQWKRRGVNLVLPRASEALKVHLCRKKGAAGRD